MPQQKKFDVDEVLDRAMDAFWENGYEAMSMTPLLERMGIQKGSFYATFNSKHSVYLQAMRRYVDQRFSAFLRALEGLQSRAAIARMFEIVEGECAGKGRHKGCLIVNASLELAPHDEETGDVVRNALKTHEKILRGYVEEGQASGEITDAIEPKALAQTLLGLIIAMRVYARAGLPKSALKALREQSENLMDFGISE